MPKSGKLLLIVLLTFQANVSLAWNAAGHQLMAAITWDLLSVQQRDYWVDILKHHPRFRKDFKNKIPKYVKFNPSTLNEWIFRQASVWPDIARGFQQKQKNKYHHSSWHYINFPIYLNQTVDTSFLNRSTDLPGNLHNNLNIAQAFKGNLAVLSKPGATKKEKAIALSWVLHLIGDAHQPLHSTALFSKYYFKKGDRGGNSVKIKGQGRIENLHWYWDSRLNNTTSFKILDLKAKKLVAKNGDLAINNQNNSIEQWLTISNKIAIQSVYSPMLLSILHKNEQQNKPLPSIYISNSYDKRARKIAEKLIVEAAYKMFTVLSQY